MRALLPFFIDELTKISMEKRARVTKDEVTKGTNITEELPDFLKKLRPGDILLSKGSLKSSMTFGGITKRFQKLRGASDKARNWTHAGVYIGDGKIRHAYAGVVGKGLVGKQRVRDHKLKTFVRLGRDMLAVRPEVPKGAAASAVSRAKDLSGRSFSNFKIMKAGVLPDARKKGETQKENLPEGIICTSLVGYVYPKLRFKGKSIHTLMPSDIVDHKKMVPVAAFSADRPLVDIKKWLDELDSKK